MMEMLRRGKNSWNMLSLYDSLTKNLLSSLLALCRRQILPATVSAGKVFWIREAPGKTVYKTKRKDQTMIQ